MRAGELVTRLGLLQLMAALEGLGREHPVPDLPPLPVRLVAALGRGRELTLEPNFLPHPVRLVTALRERGELLGVRLEQPEQPERLPP